MYKIDYSKLVVNDVKQFFQLPKNKKESDRINELIKEKSKDKLTDNK